jgi:preprotein translocase subunit SecA
MKVIGGELMDKTVGRLMQDDTPIELKLISRQIESAQKRIESMNFDTRKNLVDYDDVMNKQREVFYSRRRRLLELAEKDDLEGIASSVKQLMQDEIDYIVQAQFQGDTKLTSEESVKAVANHVLDLAPDDQLAKAFDIPLSEFEGTLMDNIRGKKEAEVLDYISGRVKQLIEAKLGEVGKDLPTVFKALLLDSMNRLWMEHLETMNDIRSGITLQSYAQRDPLVEYKTVGFRQFEEFMQRVDSSFARRFLKISKVPPTSQAQQARLATNESQIADILTGDREMPMGNLSLDKAVEAASSRGDNLRQQAMLAGGVQRTVKRESPKIGRNDPCPCGSGKKYKHCGLKNTPEHQKLTAGKES